MSLLTLRYQKSDSLLSKEQMMWSVVEGPLKMNYPENHEDAT